MFKAWVKVALLVSMPDPFAISSIVNCPDAGGSGKLLTPFDRIQPENCTALWSTLVELFVLFAALFGAVPLEQPATIAVTIASAATGCSLLPAVRGRPGVVVLRVTRPVNDA